MEVIFPFKGLHVGLSTSKQPAMTSPDLNNMRPLSAKSGRITGAQRPPVSKLYSEQIASVAGPVVLVGSVSVVEQA